MDARQILAIAWSHAQDYINDPKARENGNFFKLKMASQRVEEAAKLDPSVTFRWGDHDRTLDQIRSNLVFLEAMHYAEKYPKQALPLLNQSLALAPSSVVMQIKAETLLRLERRAEAMAVLEEAMLRSPSDMDLAKYYDVVKAEPNRGTGDYGLALKYYWVLFLVGIPLILTFSLDAMFFGVIFVGIGFWLMKEKSDRRMLTRRGY